MMLWVKNGNRAAQSVISPQEKGDCYEAGQRETSVIGCHCCRMRSFWFNLLDTERRSFIVRWKRTSAGGATINTTERCGRRAPNDPSTRIRRAGGCRASLRAGAGEWSLCLPVRRAVTRKGRMVVASACPFRVKNGRARFEYMFSALTPTPDITRLFDPSQYPAAGRRPARCTQTGPGPTDLETAHAEATAGMY
jgi:hypothetical protein